MRTFKYDIIKDQGARPFFLGAKSCRHVLPNSLFYSVALLVAAAECFCPEQAGGNGGGNNGGANNGRRWRSNGAANGGGNVTTFFSTGVVGGVKIDTRGVLTSEKDSTRSNDSRTNCGRIEGYRCKTSATRRKASHDLASWSGRGHHQVPRTKARRFRVKLFTWPDCNESNIIIVSEDDNDVILAGPAEGIEINKEGVVVGKTSRTPVIHLEDFLVAMRSVENARTGQGISVSIDPTEQGIKQLQNFYGRLKQSQTPFRPEMQPLVEQAMGQQMIKLTGVPADSRFSQVLVAADYKMKRLGMGLETAPISNFPELHGNGPEGQCKKHDGRSTVLDGVQLRADRQKRRRQCLANPGSRRKNTYRGIKV